MESINAVILAVILILVTVTAAGVMQYQPQPNPWTVDREASLRLALNDAVKGLPNTISNLIILQVPIIAGLNIPSSIQGVSIQVLNQNEIDALSRIKPVDYLIFRSIEKTGTDTAEVSLSYLLFYVAGDPGLNYAYGGKGYNYTK